jgi:hypothetical protein
LSPCRPRTATLPVELEIRTAAIPAIRTEFRKAAEHAAVAHPHISSSFTRETFSALRGTGTPCQSDVLWRTDAGNILAYAVPAGTR